MNKTRIVSGLVYPWKRFQVCLFLRFMLIGLWYCYDSVACIFFISSLDFYLLYIVYVLHNAHLHSMKISIYESCLINYIASDIILLSILLSFKVYFVVVHSSSSYITLTVTIVLLKYEYHMKIPSSCTFFVFDRMLLLVNPILDLWIYIIFIKQNKTD